MFDPKDLAAIVAFSAVGRRTVHSGIRRLRGLMMVFTGSTASPPFVRFRGSESRWVAILVRLMALAALPLILIPVAAHGAPARAGSPSSRSAGERRDLAGHLTGHRMDRIRRQPRGSEAAYWTPVLTFLGRPRLARLPRRSRPVQAVLGGVLRRRCGDTQSRVGGTGKTTTRATPCSTTIRRRPRTERGFARSGGRYVSLADATLDPAPAGPRRALLRSGSPAWRWWRAPDHGPCTRSRRQRRS